MVGKKEVLRVADNARIEVSEEEAEDFLEDFDEILEMFHTIEEIDTDDVEPAFHPIDVEPKRREDTEEETLAHEEVFSNTDNEEDNKFKGPSV